MHLVTRLHQTVGNEARVVPDSAGAGGNSGVTRCQTVMIQRDQWALEHTDRPGDDRLSIRAPPVPAE